jgi:hypothetical protein
MGGLKIDCTLIVQAINFAIAYVAIRKLLLKPAVETIQENTARERSLTRKIETATLANNAQEEHMHEQWDAYRVQVKEKTPAIVFSAVLSPSKGAPEEPLSLAVDQEYAQYLVTSLAEGLVERIEHVRP